MEAIEKYFHVVLFIMLYKAVLNVQRVWHQSTNAKIFFGIILVTYQDKNAIICS